MSRQRIHKTAGDRVKAHIERQGGRRVSVVLNSRSLLALQFLRDERGLESDTAAINFALLRTAAENLSIK